MVQATLNRRPLDTSTSYGGQHFRQNPKTSEGQGLSAMHLRSAPTTSVGTRTKEQSLASPPTSIAENNRSQNADNMYRHLENAATSGKAASAAAQTSNMVQQYGYSPTLSWYNDLIQANMSKEKGSAAELARILQEMSKEGIKPDSVFHHEALKILDIHPDALLRGEILREMHDYWYTLTNDGWHSVVAGLLEEEQLELALEKLDEMRLEQVPIQPWLYDLAIRILCEAGELDEALGLMRQRLDNLETGIYGATWSSLFDIACERLHLDVIQFVWRRQVQTRNLNPTAGQCLQVLSAAARNGDVKLANAAFSALRNDNFNSSSVYFELLMQAYERDHDLKAMLCVTAVMRELQIAIDPQLLDSLSNFLATSPAQPKEIFELLELIAMEQPIPTATFNCLIEAAMLRGNFDDAVAVYQQLYRLCIDGPDTSTFNVLLRGCRRWRGKGVAMFFAEEMLALKIPPDTLTYNWLLLICIDEGDIEDGLRYYREMQEVGHRPERDTLLQLVRHLALNLDGRVWDVIDAEQQLGVDTAPIIAHVNENWKEHKGRLRIDKSKA